jgi:hypothetical protein
MVAKRLVWAAPALLLASCLNSADTKMADTATQVFYQQVAAKQYAAMYDGASTDLKNSISSDDFVAMMQRIDQNMGACGPPVKRMDVHTKVNGQGTFRDQGYTRKCANGDLEETITIVIRGGVAKLAGYHTGDQAPSDSSD